MIPHHHHHIRRAFLRHTTTRLQTTKLLQPTTQTHLNYSTLVIAEPSTTPNLHPSTLSSITAAQLLHTGPITLLHLTTPSSPPPLPPSVTSVLHASLPPSEILAESASGAIRAAHLEYGYTHIVAPASKFGGSVVGRAAAMVGSVPITDVVDVCEEGEGDTFVRPIYAGNALCKVVATGTEGPTVLTVRSTAFEKAATAETSIEPTTLTLEETPALTSHCGSTITSSTLPDLSTATTVLSGGRGLASSENFQLLRNLASKLPGAAVGASRAAVDAGFVPNDLQVGQTGKVVAPDLYVAVGISGAIQHLSGMKDSKVIVAVNMDEDAPIFQVADYGLVGDLFEVVPELTEKV